MVKRDFAANPDVDVDAPRPKRHKDVSAEPAMTNDGDAPERGASSDREDNNGDGNGETESGNMLSPEEVREEGSKVLELLKEAVDKEGRIISAPFLRLPSKRQFPDYYEIIKRPIALDDIKTQLDNHAYPSLEAVRQDIETCFKNAKKYNVRESDIWKHAKTLHKLANKEVDKILKKGDEDGSDKEGGKKKEKGVNIHRLMKNRLQKLVSKTDETGERVLSSVFMDLPSKRLWPIYYKIINRPICIEDIFKRIKRKEYPTIPDFMNDVELVFTNAMQFNEEQSAIWLDAATLRNYFHQIMYDLPAKYNMNGIEGNTSMSPEASHPKIKLKLPNQGVAAQSGSGVDGAQNGEASNAGVRLRVPGLGASTSGGSVANSDKQGGGASAKKTKANSPATPAVSLPSTASIPYSTHATLQPTTAPAPTSTPVPALAMPTPKPARVAPLPASVKTTLPTQPIAQMQQQTPYTPFHQYTTPNHIPAQSFYNPPAPAPSQTPARGSATPAPALPTPAATAARTDAPSPVPPASAAGLYSVRLESCLQGSDQTRRRLALLNARTGVRNFLVHVPLSESKVVVRSVKFTLHDDDGDVSDVDVEEPKIASAQIPVKKRGRGRPKKGKNLTSNQEVQPPASDAQTDIEMSSPLVMPTTSPNGKKKDKPEWQVPLSKDVLVKLDGQEVTPKKTPGSSPTPVVNGGTSGDIEMDSPQPEQSTRLDDEWAVDVTAGPHVLEVGKKGNNVLWRVFLCVS